MAEATNRQELISCKKVSGVNHVNEINVSCTWTIYNLSFVSAVVDDDSDDEEDIETLTFSSTCGGSLKWNVSISLNKDPFKVFVKIAEYDMYPFVGGKMSILNDKREAAHTVEISDFKDFIEFIMINELYDEKKKLLVDDKLVLLCEIKAFSVVEEWNLDTSKDQNCSCEIFRNRVAIAKDYELLIDGRFSDIVVVVNQKIFHLHRSILAARSPVFSAMFGQEMLEKANSTVVITDIGHEVFKILVEFIYTGSVKDINSFSDEFLLQILVAASKYNLAGLINICEFILLKRLSPANAVEVLKFADFHNISDLKNHIIQYMVAHDKDFVNDSAYQSLSDTHLHLLVQLLELRANWTDDQEIDKDESSCEHKNIVMIHPVVDKNFWSVSQVNVDKWSFKWEIHNFKFHLCKNKLDTVSSQTFKQKFIWQLFLDFSDDSNKNNNDFLYLYIKVSTEEPSSDDIKIKAKYEISIVGSKNQRLECFKSSILTLIVNGEKVWIKRFKKSLLLSNPEDFLPNDALTLECNMKFGLDSYVNLAQTKPIIDCDYKHLITLSTDFEHLLGGGQCSNITVIVNKKKFLLHQTILALRSPCLFAIISQLLFLSSEQTVELVDVKPEVFEELLLFIYSGRINCLEKVAKDLYVQAEKYELDKLKCICEAYLSNNLTVDNACDIFVFAHLNKNKKLKDTAALFVVENDTEIVKTAGYKSMKDSRPQLLKDICKFQV